jgi:Fe-S cluster assembly iron-binding protein IscA
MLTVTEAAGAHLFQLLYTLNESHKKAVRLVVEGENLTMKLDNESPNDQRFEHKGETVLILDEVMGKFLADKTLDVEDDGTGPKLSLRESIDKAE